MSDLERRLERLRQVAAQLADDPDKPGPVDPEWFQRGPDGKPVGPPPGTPPGSVATYEICRMMDLRTCPET
jgi:hypothetical protein